MNVKNLQLLVTEIYKVQNNCSPKMMNKVFPINKPIHECNLRNTSDFVACGIKRIRYRSETLSYLRPRLWNILPEKHKNVQIYMYIIHI